MANSKNAKRTGYYLHILLFLFLFLFQMTIVKLTRSISFHFICINSIWTFYGDGKCQQPSLSCTQLFLLKWNRIELIYCKVSTDQWARTVFLLCHLAYVTLCMHFCVSLSIVTNSNWCKKHRRMFRNWNHYERLWLYISKRRSNKPKIGNR